MAKNGLLKYIKKQNTKNTYPDFKNLIDEFDKLLGKRYVFILANNEVVTFKVETKHFCHMLGFDKIIDATIIELLGRVGLKKSLFYNYVKDGYVNYDFIDLNGLLNEDNMNKLKAINFNLTTPKTFADTAYVSVLAEVKAQRWEMFSEKTLLSIFHNELVVDFDYNAHWSKVPANKIFYKYETNKKKNLNLFISQENSKYFIRTFFLEKDLDDYKVTYETDVNGNLITNSNGQYMKKGAQAIVDLLISVHVNTTDYSEIYTSINWKNVRKVFKDKPEYRPVQRLKTYFSNTDFEITDVSKEINNLKETLDNYIKNVEQIKDRITIKKHFNDYIQNKSDESILFFYDFGENGIDIENPESHTQFLEIDEIELFKKIETIEMKLETLSMKHVKFIKFLPLLKHLEFCEIKFIYSYFFDTKTWSENFIDDNYSLLRHTPMNKVFKELEILLGVKMKTYY